VKDWNSERLESWAIGEKTKIRFSTWITLARITDTVTRSQVMRRSWIEESSLKNM